MPDITLFSARTSRSTGHVTRHGLTTDGERHGRTRVESIDAMPVLRTVSSSPVYLW